MIKDGDWAMNVSGCDAKWRKGTFQLWANKASKNTGQMRTPHVKYSAVKKKVILEKNLG
jgi:hypothetical protein